jgi:hypothetical protein
MIKRLQIPENLDDDAEAIFITWDRERNMISITGQHYSKCPVRPSLDQMAPGYFTLGEFFLKLGLNSKDILDGLKEAVNLAEKDGNLQEAEF